MKIFFNSLFAISYLTLLNAKPRSATVSMTFVTDI